MSLVVQKKRPWGRLTCGCGQRVPTTMEVVTCGDGMANVFEAKCPCGKSASGHYPEKVERELQGER